MKVDIYIPLVEAERQAPVYHVVVAQLPLDFDNGPDDGSSYKQYEEDAKHGEGELLGIGQAVFPHPLLLCRSFHASPIRCHHEECLNLDCFMC